MRSMNSIESSISSLSADVPFAYCLSMIGWRHALPKQPKQGESMNLALPNIEDASPLWSLRDPRISDVRALIFLRRFADTSIVTTPSSTRPRSETTPRYSLSAFITTSCLHHYILTGVVAEFEKFVAAGRDERVLPGRARASSGSQVSLSS